MKTRKIWWSTLTAAAVFAATWLGAAPGRAQTGEFPSPEATPIPLNAPAAPIEPEAPARPQAVAASVSWLPIGGYVRPDADRNVTVTAASGFALDFTYARIGFHRNGNALPVLAYDATIAATSTVGGVYMMTLTTQIPVTLTSATLKFGVKAEGALEVGEYLVGYPVYVPAAMREFEWPPLNQDALEPANDNTCAIGAPLAAGKTYNGSFKSISDNDWAFVDVGSTVNMQITAANVPTPSQMQVFVAADGTCGSIALRANVADQANPSVTLSGLSGGRVYVRMVAAMVGPTAQRYTLRIAPNPTTGSFEDNDDPCKATSALADTTYTSYGDDEYDFFELNVPTTGTLSMTLGADVVTQLDLRSPVTDTNCNAISSTRQLAYRFIVANQAQIQYFVAPGKYYARMRIKPTDVPNPARAYTFRWALTPGSKPAKVCIGQDATIEDCAGDVRDNKLNIKWQGLNGNARIRLVFTGNSGGGGTGPNKCAPGSRPDIEFITTDLDGARNVDAIANGGYTVKIYVTDVASGAALLATNPHEQSVKVGCQFYRPAAAQALPEPEVAP